MNHLEKQLKALGLSLTEYQISQFNMYRKMVIKKNEVMNLTAITDSAGFDLKHFADSLSLVSAAPDIRELLGTSVDVIDIGTGAGFPGIPLKIAFPEIRLTLLDSLNKRISFLSEVTGALKLENVTLIHARAEEGARKQELRDHFDLAVSRAVANQSVLTEYCLPYVKKGGLFVAYKSGEVDEELREASHAIKVLGGTIEAHPYMNLPDSDITRSFVVIRKLTATPKAYPRKPGTAKRDPL